MKQQELLEAIRWAVHCSKDVSEPMAWCHCQEIGTDPAYLAECAHAANCQKPYHWVPPNAVHRIQTWVVDPLEDLCNAFFCRWKPFLLVEWVSSEERLRQAQDQIPPVALVALICTRLREETVEDIPQQWRDGVLVACDGFKAPIRLLASMTEMTASEASIEDGALRTTGVDLQPVKEAIHRELLLVRDHQRHLEVGAQEVHGLFQSAPAPTPPRAEVSLLVQLGMRGRRGTDPEVVAALHVVRNGVHSLVEGLVLGVLGNGVVVQPHAARGHFQAQILPGAEVVRGDLLFNLGHCCGSACGQPCQKRFPILILEELPRLSGLKLGKDSLHPPELQAFGIWVLEAQPFVGDEVHRALFARH
mmetsp:Transcript_58915/g.140618  ORF Transcript_58915/g.140618 Transcript_58915/m.140618 type:complete len:361 (+) Transcript_58915:486-1568(+)